MLNAKVADSEVAVSKQERRLEVLETIGSGDMAAEISPGAIFRTLFSVLS